MKNKINQIFISIYLVCIVFTSCQNASKIQLENSIFKEPIFKEHKELKSNKINLSPYITNKILDMQIYGNYLIIEDYFNKESILFAYNTIDRFDIKKFCFKGKGPRELMFPDINVFYDQISNEFQLFDPNLKKLIVFKNSDFHKFNPTFQEYHFLKNKEFITNLIKVKKYFIGFGQSSGFSDKRFIILDSISKPISFVGNYTNPCKDIEDEVWKDIFGYYTHIKISPNMSKLVTGTYIGGILDIYDLQNLPNDISLINSLSIYKPIYTYSEGVHRDIQWGNNTIIGFEDIYVTDKYIYTLLNGCKGDKYRLPNKISVFDWEGNPIIQYHLDRNICSIAVDEKNKTIYAGEYTEKASNLISFQY